jgi:hypothetical protein
MVPGQGDADDVLILLGEIANRLPCPVRGTVIDEHDLVIAPRGLTASVRETLV